MRKGGNGNRVCFEGGSYLSVRYCEQRRGEGELCVGTVAWQGDMISGQRVVCVQVRMDNQQTTGRALGKGWGSLPQSSTLVNWLRDSLITMANST